MAKRQTFFILEYELIVLAAEPRGPEGDVCTGVHVLLVRPSNLSRTIDDIGKCPPDRNDVV